MTDPNPTALTERAQRLREHDARLLKIVRGQKVDGAPARDDLAHAIAAGSVTPARACEGKRRYCTPEYAEKMRAVVRRLYDSEQQAYYCPFCRGYHLGKDHA